MAYGNNPGPADAMDEGMPPAPAPAEAEEGEYSEATTHLPTEVLGGQTFNPGDEIVLQVVSVDDTGITVKYAEEGGGEDEGASWEDDFRKEMSPRAPQQEAM